MSVVIIGGNECMVCRYQEICKKNGYKAKVFAKENGPMKKKIGSPDLMILFTGTVSHKTADLLQTSLGVAEAGQASVGSIHQVLQGIQQGAVQIE